MKIILLILVFVSFQCKSQKTKPTRTQFEWPLPIKDSSYEYIEADTIYGKVPYTVNNATILCDGFIITGEVWTKHIIEYSKKDQAKIDSFNADTSKLFCIGWVETIPGSDKIGYPFKRIYIKTPKGYKQVSNNSNDISRYEQGVSH